MMKSARLVGTWVAYPIVLAMTIGLYYGLQHQGLGAAASSYIAAVVGGVGFITILEYCLPFRNSWHPTSVEIQSDLVFMALIQLLLPKFLSLFSSIWLVRWLSESGWGFTNYWPHQYPVWIQMLIMMVSSDFFRYWLHRAAHEWQPLWKFHAVHHSVDKLYWLNVGRFHPIDKSLQFVCDALPFILLGVSEEVLTLYFVVYSIKGFFQHSNVDVKLGPLNYLISGPELHRWHHSKVVAESNQNYGNNFIIWDIAFGTFYLPSNKTVRELGLQQPYPMEFVSQMRAPFLPDRDPKNVA